MRLFIRVPVALLFGSLLACGEARAALSTVGDVSPAIDPLGYGIPGQPGSIGAVTIGLTDVGGLFINQQFEPGPLISSGDGIIGRDEGSIGAVDLTDFFSDWLMSGDLVVGQEGTGAIDIKDSAKVQVGNNSFAFASVPQSAPPTDVITDGGLATIGQFQTGLGTVTLSGVAGTRLVVEDLIVGDYGVGNLIATSRASVITQKGFIGNGDGSVGYVSVSDLGTRWTVGDNRTSIDGRLVIGNVIGVGDIGEADNEAQEGQGQGTLRIANQGLVQVSDEVIIGLNGHLLLETKGRLRILPTSEIVTDGDLDVLDVITNFGVISGDGFVDFVGVNDGPTNPDTVSTRPLTFLNTAVGEIRNAANATGTLGGTNQREKLVFNGNALNLDTLINNGTIESLGGEMEFNVPVVNNFEIVARDAVMRFPQVLFNNGPDGILVLGGDTTVHGIVDNTGGGSVEVLPGSDVAVIGDLRFSTASIVSLVIGDDASNLFISGVTDLGNAILELNYSNGDAPQAGDTYEILESAGGLGATTFFNTPVPAGGALWDITYVGDSVFASFGGIAAGPSGADFNGDGIVNQLDIIIWQDNYGRTSPPNLDAFGDADSDGDVDGRDFLRIQREFGGPGVEPIVANLASVPEPSALVLLLSAAVGLVARRKR